MKFHTSLLCAMLLLAPAFSSASECRNWETTVLPSDRPSVQVTVDTLVAMLPAQPVDKDPEFLADETQALDEARGLLQRARHPLPLGNITGAWRMASLQMGRKGGVSYPFFAGHIERTACGYSFAKTSGSQRRSGVLLPMQGEENALAFLGTSTVNDDPTGTYGPAGVNADPPSGSYAPINSAGRLLRIGPKTLLIIFDADEKGFELYRLDR